MKMMKREPTTHLEKLGSSGFEETAGRLMLSADAIKVGKAPGGRWGGGGD